MIVSSVMNPEIEWVTCSECMLNNGGSSKKNSTTIDHEIVIPSTPEESNCDNYLGGYSDDDISCEMLQENDNTPYKDNIKRTRNA